MAEGGGGKRGSGRQSWGREPHCAKFNKADIQGWKDEQKASEREKRRRRSLANAKLVLSRRTLSS